MRRKPSFSQQDIHTVKNQTELYIDNAIAWAERQLGRDDYCLRCLAFVEDAYGAFVFYDMTGEIAGERANYGHVGLHLGDGRIIHAWDEVRIDSVAGIEVLEPAEGWTRPRYIGWAAPDRILQGHLAK
jgi:hypothetical protein